LLLFKFLTSKLDSKISQLSLEEKIVVITPGVLTFALVVDMELSKVADLLHRAISSVINTFIVVSAIYLEGQYILLRFAKVITADLRSQRKDIRFIELIASTVQGFLIIVFLLLIAGMTLGTSYDLFILIVVTIASNGLT
jgi:hypothetical protein